ncbi:Transposase-like protein [Favolaschia claudopus]|uniref:Transposase-like protein n=1 Tax=Favolaschia claudopus TaxID=2862362 RepID=A0AAW0CT98_9AGAR
MSRRRLNRVCGKSLFTIFILGAFGRSLPILVNVTTCLDDIYNHLEDLHLIPRNRRSQFYFTADGQQVTSGSTLHSLGIGPLSHLSLRIRILGGADEEADRPTKKKVKRKPKPKPTTAARAAEGDNTDPEDKDFTSGATSDSDSEASITMTNEEIANSLPTKTSTLAPRRKAPSKKDKGKNRASQPLNNRSPIYLFYEDVECDSDGEKEDGSRYWKCRHGKRRIFTITKSMRDNTKGLQQHLEKHFVHLYRLYKVLDARDGSATAEEKAWAAGTTPMDEATKAKYANKIEELNKDIKEMFTKQAAAAEEPWDQDHFEDLVAKWVAACDQPFTAVNEPEFREMLQYAHRKRLNIPHDPSVKARIQRMSVEMRAGLKQIFAENLSDFVLSLDAWTSSNGYAFLAIVVHYIGNDGKLEECLIDFREFVGQHSGENMAAVVWQTVEDFGLKGRVSSPFFVSMAILIFRR